MAVIAVNLTSTQVTTAAISIAGKVMHKKTIPLEKKTGKDVSLLIQNQIESLLSTYKNDPIQIKSIGISVPGISYSKSGCVWAPNIPGWDNYPLLKDLNNFLSDSDIKIKIGSNRTCYILGEYWQGAAKKSKNAIYLSVGNGIGAGILIDGKILHGFNDGVGAVGRLCLGQPFDNTYKDKGFFNTKASWAGMVESVYEKMNKLKNYEGFFSDKDLKTINIFDMFHAYKIKDKIAVSVFNECIEFWGMAAADLISLFNPEIFIFGGSVFGPGLEFLNDIKNVAAKWAQPHNYVNVKFLGSQLGVNAALFGAGQLASGKF